MVDAARAGDPAALEQVLRAHQPGIHAVCRRLTGNDADAADATQEALVAVVRGLPRFDGRSALSTWVYRVATNAALDELRRRARRPMPLRSDDPLPETGAVGGPPAFDEALADRDALDRALASLPEDFRAAVVLRDVAGLDYAEIAAVLGIPGGTVRSRIARGRAALAAALGPDRAGNRGASATVREGDAR